MISERTEPVYRKLTITFETEEEEIAVRGMLSDLINGSYYESDGTSAASIAKRLLQTMDTADGMPDPSWVDTAPTLPTGYGGMVQ